MVTDTVKRILQNQAQAVDSEIRNLKRSITQQAHELEKSKQNLAFSENILSEINKALKE